jgi:hypothetical protein
MSVSMMERRVAVAQATLDHFRNKPLRYGTRDCVRMAAFHLRKMGHQVRLPPSGSYASARSALKAMRARGFDNLGEAVDSYGFERIPPAAAISGDLMLVPGDGGFGGALHVVLGNGKTVSFHEDAVGATILEPFEFVAAWRVPIQ